MNELSGIPARSLTVVITEVNTLEFVIFSDGDL